MKIACATHFLLTQLRIFAMKFTKYLQAAVFGLLIACSGAFAQTQSSANASQQSTSQAQNQGVTLESTVNMPPASPYVKQDTDFNTNQAASAPAVIGSAAPSPAGCVAIEGASASVVFMNGGKSSAVEPPGCMANLLADRVGRLQHNAMELGVGMLSCNSRPGAVSVSTKRSWNAVSSTPVKKRWTSKTPNWRLPCFGAVN
jgi:hypothetical protein